jgi:hypothetical protein
MLASPILKIILFRLAKKVDFAGVGVLDESFLLRPCCVFFHQQAHARGVLHTSAITMGRRERGTQLNSKG